MNAFAQPTTTLSASIIHCAGKVHEKLGKGFDENIYQRALAIELEKQKLPFIREQEWPVFYDEMLVGKQKLDFVVDQQVLVVLKATKDIDASVAQQIEHYLNAFHLEVGLLIYFGDKSLQFKRFANKQLKHSAAL